MRSTWMVSDDVQTYFETEESNSLYAATLRNVALDTLKNWAKWHYKNGETEPSPSSPPFNCSKHSRSLFFRKTRPGTTTRRNPKLLQARTMPRDLFPTTISARMSEGRTAFHSNLSFSITQFSNTDKKPQHPTHSTSIFKITMSSTMKTLLHLRQRRRSE